MWWNYIGRWPRQSWRVIAQWRRNWRRSTTHQTASGYLPCSAIARRKPMTHANGSVFHRNLAKTYNTIVSGNGVYLYDREGRRYLDAVGGAGVVVIGHGVSLPLQALAEASGQITYVYGEDFTTPWQEELAERLLGICAASGGAVYFVSGGSEANETAI